MKTLKAGYFCGEFGWQLMRWQGICRATALRLKKTGVIDKTIIGCEKQYTYLYEDFADGFEFFKDEIKSRNMWLCNNTTYPFVDRKNKNELYFTPTKNVCANNKEPQIFIKYGKKVYEEKIILLHHRSTENLNTGYRNWDILNWNKIISTLKKKKYYICSIGSITESLHIPDTTDIRGIDLKSLANIMTSSKLLISPSSGPVHFASLCGCPHIVWGQKTGTGLIDNKYRYEHLWNPFKTKVEYIDTWDPKPKTVLERVYKCLN